MAGRLEECKNYVVAFAEGGGDVRRGTSGGFSADVPSALEARTLWHNTCRAGSYASGGACFCKRSRYAV